MHPAEPRVPLTLDQLITHLIELRAAYSDQGHRPVHLLDMALDDGDGLITAVDLDCFDEQQGPVISLLSRPMPDICSPPSSPCEDCRLIFVAEFPGRPPVER